MTQRHGTECKDIVLRHRATGVGQLMPTRNEHMFSPRLVVLAIQAHLCLIVVRGQVAKAINLIRTVGRTSLFIKSWLVVAVHDYSSVCVQSV